MGGDDSFIQHVCGVVILLRSVGHLLCPFSVLLLHPFTLPSISPCTLVPGSMSSHPQALLTLHHTWGLTPFYPCTLWLLQPCALTWGPVPCHSCTQVQSPETSRPCILSLLHPFVLVSSAQGCNLSPLHEALRSHTLSLAHPCNLSTFHWTQDLMSGCNSEERKGHEGVSVKRCMGMGEKGHKAERMWGLNPVRTLTPNEPPGETFTTWYYVHELLSSTMSKTNQ